MTFPSRSRSWEVEWEVRRWGEGMQGAAPNSRGNHSIIREYIFSVTTEFYVLEMTQQHLVVIMKVGRLTCQQWPTDRRHFVHVQRRGTCRQPLAGTTAKRICQITWVQQQCVFSWPSSLTADTPSNRYSRHRQRYNLIHASKTFSGNCGWKVKRLLLVKQSHEISGGCLFPLTKEWE